MIARANGFFDDQGERQLGVQVVGDALRSATPSVEHRHFIAIQKAQNHGLSRSYDRIWRTHLHQSFLVILQKSPVK